MRTVFAGGLLLVACLALMRPGEAQIMSVDLGHEFFKVALMRQGAPLEIVLNNIGGRKTPTAASFFEAIRTFGTDAVAHASKAPAKVPVFFHSLLGNNFTSEDDVKPGGAWWQKFGLPKDFYDYDLVYESERGVPAFYLGENKTFSGEKVLANIFFFAQQIAQTSADGKPIKDLVVTVPPEANLRHRQAIQAAGEIAGLRVLTLVHEGAAFAVQRAVDFSPEKGAVERGLFYNLGSRKAEVTIVQFESRQAGMVAGKTAPVVTVLGSAVDYGIGGHLFDLKIAQHMMKKFQEKNPKLAEGVEKNARARGKLLKQAEKCKAVLSANKGSPFIVESMYEDTDFQTSIKREEFEEMCKDLLAYITVPIENALAAANVTMQDIQHIELVGGAWRIPKVQQILGDFFEKGAGKKIQMGQHLNGEEGAAMGAALVGANASSSFRVKKIFFTDITAHAYSVQVTSLNGAWEKNMTTLYPVGGPLGGKKKLSFTLEEDFAIKLFEDGVLVSEYVVTGLHDKLTNGSWKEYNTTGPPKIAVNVNLESSGLIEVKNPIATIEELYWANITREKKKEVSNSTNSSSDENATDNASAESASADSSEAPKEEPAKEEPAKEEPAKEESSEAPATEDVNASVNDSVNGSDVNGSLNSTANKTPEIEYEVVQKQKKKKHEKKLTVKRTDYRPVPMSEEEITEARKDLEAMFKAEQEVQAMAQIKNDLEADIYSSREKVERDDIVKVSTEEQRAEVIKYCTEYEEWMYEGSTEKSEFDKRVNRLKELLGPMEERANELDARSEMPEQVEEAVAKMNKFHADITKNKTWVNETKFEAAVEKITNFSAWWSKKQASQKDLPLHEAPAYTKVEVMDALKKLQKEFDKGIKAATKKPKEDKKKKNATNTSSDTAKEEPVKEEALPADATATQAALDAVREKKLEAVEKEDFDEAHALKKREEALKAHLATFADEKSEAKTEEKTEEKKSEL